ncbi:hypothetical protein BDY21DRAFT_385534 [Lineolata rhizophorae]|uniref:Protein sip5 n=1 Tax=Lineolata rhizophorae TaxID=578093 RepID=A0A6A6P266_9PEZI|nr:hypothetical protein BDY21DRAFT_385534 [Lineolata rhizophorae]
MGNSSTKEARPPSSHPQSGPGSASSPTAAGPSTSSPHGQGDRLASSSLYGARAHRGSRHDIFAAIGGGGPSDRDSPALEVRRETKAEREARKLEKERVARAKERERSMREEGVDGGYLVTLGTYTGPEDFNKAIVRQLMIERRLAPFWRGLNDHKDSWVEHQLVAAARGLLIPPADEAPSDVPSRTVSKTNENAKSSDNNISHLTVPMSGRSQSYNSDRSTSYLSPSHPASSLPSPTSPLASPSSPSPLFRGRAKTLAALTTSSKDSSHADMTPQEVQLPKDPYYNGQAIEAFLYKDATECPICFLYYPPYLNKTRCCDQPICSECFVQIKRPDPHPPEHADPSNPNAGADSQSPQQSDDSQLVSEPAACPFCVQPEFGVTYEPPPFRRGLAYAHQGHPQPLASATSAMSSTSSLASAGFGSPTGISSSRRRTTSLSANAPAVITTDRIRPDWAKKLADARAHALRRSAAATALHNAAYVLGNQGPSDGRSFGLGRRRRLFGGDSPGSSGRGTPRLGEGVSLARRLSSRRSRMEDLEELMMMEAIRLSLAAEEERKRKEEKEAAKEQKKKEKREAKETRKREKKEKKNGGGGIGNLVQVEGKGKGVDRTGGAGCRGGSAGFNPLSEPTSTINTSAEPLAATAAAAEDPQRHLENSRAQIQTQNQSQQPNQFADGVVSSMPNPDSTSSHRTFLRRHLSNASSSASSLADGGSSSFGPSPNTSGLDLAPSASGDGISSETLPEPMLNFQSLAAMIGDEEKRREDADQRASGDSSADGGKESSNVEDASAALQETSEDLANSHATVKPSNGLVRQVSGADADMTNASPSIKGPEKPFVSGPSSS